MMKFHTPSFFMGFASATVLMVTGKRLKPVAVELGAVGLHLARLGRGVVERQREHAEDLWAEVEERVRERARRPLGVRPSPTTRTVHIDTTAAGGVPDAPH
jgi:hypothetical protein